AGLPMQRHMAKYGTTEEMFGAHVIAQRANAVLNEDAFFRTPLTMEDYLSSRYVSKPTRILDCDYPCDSASAVIYTTVERARDWKNKPVFVDAAVQSYFSYDQLEEMYDAHDTSPLFGPHSLWADTSLRPEDVDCAQLYDGFTI